MESALNRMGSAAADSEQTESRFKPPSRHVGLLIGTSGAYARGLLRGIARFNRERGGWTTYHWPHGLHESLPGWMKHWKGHGILARVGTRRLAKAVAKLGVPVVNLRSAILDVALPLASLDNLAIANTSAGHFLELGLTHFAFCGTPRGYHLGHDERVDAFRKVIEESGRHCDVYLSSLAPVGPSSWEREQRRMARWLESLPKPVGIMACNDEKGVEVLNACRRVGIAVPDEAAVIGVDNDEALCELSIPPLSSIDVHADQVGYEAAGLLDRLMSGEKVGEASIRVPPRGVVARNSTDVVISSDPEIDRAAAFIRENGCHHLSVSDVLAFTGLSRTSLEMRFKKVLGRTLHQEIQRVQLKRAKSLLAVSKLPIKQVALDAGFGNVQYLTRVFRKATGETPAQYRRRHS